MKYHVFGIGNALVDKEFEVTDEFLQSNSIEKGLMTLLDESQHHDLLKNLTQKFELKKRASGGSAANTIVTISQLGGDTFYACKVAKDEFGDFYRGDLTAAGVTTKLEDVQGEGHTGKCMVMITPDAERTMNTYLGITSDFSEDELQLDELKNAEYLYVEGYLVTSDVSRGAAIKAMQFARENGIKVALTFSDPAMAAYFKDGLTEMLGDGVDLLFCNEEEAMTFTVKDNIDDAIAQLSQKAKKLVVTQGANGALVVNGNESISIDAVKANAVDTNGAGDMFAGAFMYGTTHGLGDQVSADLASAAAAKVVSVFGARLAVSDYKELLSHV